jgi:hypothetical protein
LNWHEEIAVHGLPERLCWWRDSLNTLTAHPTGCGIGNWKDLAGYMVSAGKISNGCVRLHNTWVQNLVEIGVGFGILGFAYLWHCLRRLRGVHIAHACGILAMLVVSSTNSLFRMNATNGLIAIALLARLELEMRKVWDDKDCIIRIT